MHAVNVLAMLEPVVVRSFAGEVCNGRDNFKHYSTSHPACPSLISPHLMSVLISHPARPSLTPHLMDTAGQEESYRDVLNSFLRLGT